MYRGWQLDCITFIYTNYVYIYISNIDHLPFQHIYEYQSIYKNDDFKNTYTEAAYVLSALNFVAIYSWRKLR